MPRPRRSMTSRDRCIAVCATAESALQALTELARAAGADAVLAIHGWDPVALAAARERAKAYVLQGAPGRPGERLAAALAARPPGAPLIAVGDDPALRASPSVWLPAVPAPGRLARLLADLLDDEAAASAAGPPAAAWRRKTDLIIGDSPAIRQVLGALDRLAPATTPVLITGESGVGKELVARSLHYSGPRARGPFVAINCAAIPEALFEAELFGYRRGAFTGAVNPRPGAIEAAHRGTLFLDEIGEMPPAMQAKLLRVLETGEVQRIGASAGRVVDFRLVTATNCDLERAVRDGGFRADLYYRVHVYPLHVPALRDRAEDIPRLVHHYLAVIAAREHRPVPRMTPGALDKLAGHAWPGNVRELVNLIERAVLCAGEQAIDAEHVFVPERSGSPATARGTAPLMPYREAKARFELDYYAQLMQTAGGNVSRAAALGRKTRKEIYEALKRCGLTARPAEPASAARRRRA
ncbi:MAG TPA: sigma 54-interacting transcriptional regulator [Kofleriaceae bacterium]|nr:sigma 54-interacting transcriptional regulator [Kofleriaceae bacterium]